MEVHRQKCQACGSRTLVNLLTRDNEAQTTVFVCCAVCRALVARYGLSSYYHHGKGLESFLRSQHHHGTGSGRDMMEQFQRVQDEAMDGYNKAVETLQAQGKPLPPDDPEPER